MNLRDIMIPPGYVSMDEALERARQQWPREQEPRLRGLLVHGTIQGAAVAPNGEIQKLDASFWAADRGLRALATGQFCADDHAKPTGRAVVSEADLDARLPTMAQHMAKVAEERRRRRQEIALPSLAKGAVSTKNKPGAKATYDEVAFLIEAFRLLYDRSKPPKSQAELMEQALTAYQNAELPGGMPSSSWAKPLISRLWRRLFLDEG